MSYHPDETHQAYIGDGVYASFDGYQIWLEAGHNRIALEPEVYYALISYKEQLMEKLAASAKDNDE